MGMTLELPHFNYHPFPIETIELIAHRRIIRIKFRPEH